MNSNNHNRVLAIGIDAAEPSLIREMIQQNELPSLARLLQAGKWLRVKSSAHIGSGSVLAYVHHGSRAIKAWSIW